MDLFRILEFRLEYGIYLVFGDLLRILEFRMEYEIYLVFGDLLRILEFRMEYGILGFIWYLGIHLESWNFVWNIEY